ncbi:MAG: DUF2442 domain-containing protein [Marinilabilia sp.]
MSTLEDKGQNVRAKDPIDVLIFEKGLRIKNVIIDKEVDLLGVILNNGKILETKISSYPRLNNATLDELEKWELISNGIGITWENLNEDLSVKGFIQTVAINDMLEHLQAFPGNDPKASA